MSTTGIEVEDVDVELAADAVDHEEVPVSRGVARLAAIPCRAQHDHQDIEVVAIKRDVEVIGATVCGTQLTDRSVTNRVILIACPRDIEVDAATARRYAAELLAAADEL